MQWFRLYHEILDDPKTGTLNDSEFRLFVEMLCLASKASADGDTKLDAEGLKWSLRRPIQKHLANLEARELAVVGPAGTYIVPNWTKRQFRSDDVTRRVKKHRGNVSETLQETLPETLQETAQPVGGNVLDTDTDTDTEKKQPARKRAEFAKPDWVPAAEWDAFLESRRKNPPTARAKELLVRELEKLRDQGHDPAQVLEQSTRNGWRDVFPLRSGNAGSTAGRKLSLSEETELGLERFRQRQAANGG